MLGETEEKKFFLANCRSVVKKTESVVDHFENSDFAFGILTETWLTDSKEIKICEEFLESNGLNLITKNRAGRGGGVAVIFREREIAFKRHNFFTGSYEILAAKASVPVAGGNLFVFACYYPPSMRQEEVDRMNELISDEILRLRIKEKGNPLFIIAGDMNKKNVDCFLNINGITLIETAPTRGNEVLDMCYTNCNIAKNNVQIPLWSYDGVDSDHKVVNFSVVFKSICKTYSKFKSRKITKRGEEKFCELMQKTDWESIDSFLTVNEKTDWLHTKIEEYKDLCFPYKWSKVRSDEDPWITDHIRDRIKERNRMFAVVGRGPDWKKIRNEVRSKMSASRRAYYDREVAKIKNASNKRGLAYSALKNLKCASRPKQWSIADCDRNKNEKVIAEELADYFNEISSEYDSVNMRDLPSTYDRPIFALTEDMIVKRIKESKKPNSSVPGDIPPRLIMALSETIAVPACKIFNCVPGECWPAAWKKEYQTVIPKKPRPEGYADLRNLSCTNFLSKILESFVIDSIKSEISLSELQYGGIKGCGTDNFLVELWNNVLEPIDEKGKVASIMSVDFSKAFNRLDHQACLKKMSEKHASNQTLRMVFSFLEGREMCIKTSEGYSETRNVKGGSPQGTKLGNLLFCIAIDDITDPPPSRENHHGEEASPLSAIPEQYLPAATSTPVLDDSFNPNPYGFRPKLRVLNDTDPFPMLNQDEYEQGTWEVGYIDDINVGETLDTSEAISHYTTKKEHKEIRSKGCEEMFDVIEKNGKKVGMVINPAKTQLLCLSANNNARVTSFASINGKRLESGEKLKVLGFMFGETPSVKYHIQNLIKKFHKSIWSISHLKKARLEDWTLVQVYTSMCRPLLEYASNVFHPMITKEDGEKLEACQRTAMKLIFGFKTSYEAALERAQIKTLCQRRKELFEKFCIKMSQSERFRRKWLPKKFYDETCPVLRKRKEYVEFNSRSERLYNSPLFAMRRFLNERS